MKTSLRIGIDGRSLGGGRTGVGTYTTNLLEQLLISDPTISLLLVTNEALPEFPWLDAERVKVAQVQKHSANNFLWSNLALRRELARHTLDLFHSPGYTIPLRLSAPAVVTIHDVSYAAHPEWYPYRGGRLRNIWYRASALRARCIITGSEFSRREIIRSYSLPPEAVVLIPYGVDRCRYRRIRDQEKLEGLRQRYRLRGDFLLFVGDIHPRRNVDRIIAAFDMIRDAGARFSDLELVLIGRDLDRPIAMRVEDSHTGAVRRLGYVPEEDLPLFYSAAGAFVFPSLYEGFGLGVLESMACGCPVIVGRGTACEEVAGTAGIAVDPWSARSIADAAYGLLTDSELASRCSELGRKRSEQFSWKKAAEETLVVYREVLS